MKLPGKIQVIAYLFIFYATSLFALTIVSQRYEFNIHGVHAELPYASNYLLHHKNSEITQLIIAIHSSNYDAQSFFNNIYALSKKMGKEKMTLLISPQFMQSSSLESSKKADFLFWDNPPFLGSSNARYLKRRVQISAYEILDEMIDKVTKSGFFPKLRRIVIVGHSAGGQFVNRYCAYSRFEKFGLNVRYIVMAPSSYLYFNKERAIKGTLNHFEIPKAEAKTYNNWGYGLDKLYQVHSRNKVTASMMENQYVKSEVIYLVGSNDNNSNDSTASKTAASMWQGRNRVERAIIYAHYLEHYFGKEISSKHRFHTVPNVGHSSKDLINSKIGKSYLLESATLNTPTQSQTLTKKEENTHNETFSLAPAGVWNYGRDNLKRLEKRYE
ncbi:hypothetical protein KKG72_02820 [bacterium]|nr:hypothetical protein [bacterium]MBU1994234.1 hypothetical protein [bacterium]